MKREWLRNFEESASGEMAIIFVLPMKDVQPLATCGFAYSKGFTR
jgi:hypothetical protein